MEAGTCGQKLLYKDMNASHDVRLALMAAHSM